jgi:disulfide bond formation protein DsbB
MFQEYSEYSTIAGLLYIFMPDQTRPGKIFWTIFILLMIILGIYWSIYLLNSWNNSQVITSVASTGIRLQALFYTTDKLLSLFHRLI